MRKLHTLDAPHYEVHLRFLRKLTLWEPGH